jgi:hypothetical protein
MCTSGAPAMTRRWLNKVTQTKQELVFNVIHTSTCAFKAFSPATAQVRPGTSDAASLREVPPLRTEFKQVSGCLSLRDPIGNDWAARTNVHTMCVSNFILHP